MEESEVPILAGFGFLLQYLRGFSWFGDGATILVALLAATVMAVKNHGPDPWAIGLQALLHFPEVLGGVAGATMLSYKVPTWVVPKYNAYSNPTDDEQAVSD